MIKLSILICSTPDRIGKYLLKLLNVINHQVKKKDIELLILTDNEKMSIGEKRNKLKNMAKGDYIVYVDDDDLVSNDYVSELYKATLENKDCIVFNERRINFNKKEFILKYRLDIDEKNEHKTEKYPNSRVAIKRSIVEKIDFREINLDEDDQWGVNIRPYLKTSTVIDKVLYFYNYNINTSKSGHIN